MRQFFKDAAFYAAIGAILGVMAGWSVLIVGNVVFDAGIVGDRGDEMLYLLLFFGAIGIGTSLALAASHAVLVALAERSRVERSAFVAIEEAGCALAIFVVGSILGIFGGGAIGGALGIGATLTTDIVWMWDGRDLSFVLMAQCAAALALAMPAALALKTVCAMIVTPKEA